MTVDVLLVKYTPNELSEMAWEKTLETVSKWDCGVLIHDNNVENIGLVKARNILLDQSEADVVVLMDFDFNEIDVNIKKMARVAMDFGVVVPRDTRRKKWYGEWEIFEDCYCNFMVIERSLLNIVNNFDEKFVTAYADWDLLNKLSDSGLVRHNSSVVNHIGLSATVPNIKEKRKMWAKDLVQFSGKRWRP